MAALTSINYRPSGDGIAGAINGIDQALGFANTLQGNLLNASHPVNSANNKWQGRRVLVTDRGVVVTAIGQDATSVWQTEDGVYQITPA